MLEFFSHIPLFGTALNSGAILIGGTAGILLTSRFPKRIMETTLQGMGLVTLFLGLSMAQKSANLLLMVGSIVLGTILGEALQLEDRAGRLVDRLKKTLRIGGEGFSDGMVTSSLLFCVGSVAILGSFEEGLHGTHTLLATKAVMDGVASVALAASMGIGVLSSSVPVFLYQGTLALLARSLQSVLLPGVVAEITATGGILLIGMGISILGIRKIPVLNMLPSLLFAGLLAFWFV